jgi:hypothetical protein
MLPIEFFPDNKFREARLLQLSTDVQSYFNEAKKTYEHFVQLLKEVNKLIANVYKKANLTPPSLTDADIFDGKKALLKQITDRTFVAISSIVLDVIGVAAMGYLAPAITIMLVEANVLAAETAATVLVSVFGLELLTVAGLLGGIIGAIVVGGAIIAVTLGINALTEWNIRTQLRKKIYAAGQLRIKAKLALDKSKGLLDSLKSVKTACEVLIEQLKANDIGSDKVIQSLIKKTVNPDIQAMENITEESIKNELNKLDAGRNSWTKEDEEGKNITSTESIPIYFNVEVRDFQNLIPIVPEGLKLIAERPVVSQLNILRVPAKQGTNKTSYTNTMRGCILCITISKED